MSGKIYLYKGPLEYWYAGKGSPYGLATANKETEPLAQFGVLEWSQPTTIGQVLPRRAIGAGDTLVEPSPNHPSTTAVGTVVAETVSRAKLVPMFIYKFDSGENVQPRLQSIDIRGFDFKSVLFDFKSLNASTQLESVREDVTETEGELFLSHSLPRRLINEDFQENNIPAPDTDRLKTAAPLVIVGVIDDGLPFAHGNFRGTPKSGQPGRSRIDYVWLQAAEGKRRDSVAFGTELTGADIEALLDKHKNDEDAIYRDPLTGAVDGREDVGTNILRNYTHGAHVMDRAAGFQMTDLEYENRDKVRVIGVQLPRSSLRDTSGFSKEAFVLAGVHYIVDRAQRLAKAVRKGGSNGKVKVLINISLGTSGGPKDGSHILERAIDEIAETASVQGDLDVEVVLPTGNSFASRMYAESLFPRNNGWLSLPWRIQPNDRTSSHLEVRLNGSADLSADDVQKALDVEVIAPSEDMQLSEWVQIKGGLSDLIVGDILKPPMNDAVIGQVSFDRRGGQDWRLSVILAPTEHEEHFNRDSAANAPSGRWTIKLTGRLAGIVNELHLRCSVHRDEDPAGTSNGGRQSYFDFGKPADDFGLFTQSGARDPRLAKGKEAWTYAPVDERGKFVANEEHQVVKPFGSINGWGTGTGGKSRRSSVAGFAGQLTKGKPDNFYSVGSPARYSAAGRRLADGKPEDKSKVAFAALSDRSPNQPGVRGSGTKTGSNTILIGTSAAAPAYVRVRVLEALGMQTLPFNQSKKLRLGKATSFVRGKKAEMHALKKPKPKAET